MSSRQLTRNFAALFLSNVVGQLLILWAFVHLATVFGPEGFGRFAFAQVIALHFLYIADFGLQTLGTRTIAQDRENIAKHVARITLLRFLLALACFGLLVIFSVVVPRLGDARSLIIIFGFGLIPFALLLEWVFLGIERAGVVGAGRISKGAVFAALVVLFVSSSDHLLHAASFYVVSMGVGAGILLGVYLRGFGLASPRADWAIFGRILFTAVPFAAGSVIAQVNFNFGTLALGFFEREAIVGFFSAAHKIVLFMLAFAVVAAGNAILPLVARSYKISLTLFGDSLRKLLRLFALIALPIGIGGSILGSQIMSLLFPPDYQEGVIVFQIAIWMVVIAIYRVIFENAIIASKSQRSYFVGYVLAGTVTVLGNVLLIPIVGLTAPAIVGVLSESILLIYFAGSCKHVRPSYMVKITLKPLLAAMLMGLALLALPWNVFALIGIGAGLYFALLVFFRCVTLKEVVGYVHSFVQGADGPEAMRIGMP